MNNGQMLRIEEKKSIGGLFGGFLVFKKDTDLGCVIFSIGLDFALLMEIKKP